MSLERLTRMETLGYGGGIPQERITNRTSHACRNRLSLHFHHQIIARHLSFNSHASATRIHSANCMFIFILHHKHSPHHHVNNEQKYYEISI